jgi:hypothetical protein
MPLSPYALATVAEFKTHVNVSGIGQDENIAGALNRASDVIEQYLDRLLVKREDDRTEYHTMTAGGLDICTDKLWTMEYPIISVVSIHEDTAWPRTYGASSLLVEGTDYIVLKSKGLIRRIGSGGSRNWATGLRAIRLVYEPGFDGVAAVPERFKLVALRFAALIFREKERRSQGVLTESEPTGQYARFGPATLTDDMKADLYPERRLEFSRTGEYDS